MNIRQKCAAAIAVSLAISAILNVAVLRFSVFPSFIEIERRGAESDIRRALAAIETQSDKLSLSVFVYSTWDDSYHFAQNGDSAYVTENLTSLAADNMKVDFISIHGLDGKPMFQGAFEEGADGPAPPGPLALSAIDPQGRLVATSDTSLHHGLLMTAKGPMLVASRPVLLSSGAGPFSGTYVMGRFLDEELIAELNEATHVKFEVQPAVEREALAAPEGAALAALEGGEETHIADTGEGTLAGYALLRDIYGQPALLVHADVGRAVSETGLRALLLAVGGIVAAGLVVLAVTVALLQCLLVGPISHLTEHLLTVGSSGDLSRRVGLQRSDEIGLLGRQFDDMLEKLAEARRQLLDQSYSAGVAEMPAGVLHNIRKQLAPLSLRLARLQAALDKPANNKLALAIKELKSPTGSPERTEKIIKFVELSCKRSTETQAETIGELKSVAQDFVRIESVLRELDRFSRSHSSPVEVRLIDLVRETVAMLPKYPDIEVTIRIDPAMEGCPPIAAEPFVLKHVVQNLVVNAIEATTAAGKTRGTIAIGGTVTSQDGKPCVDLQIRDEGVGIAPDKLVQVFARGFSTKTGEKRGSGLHWCANSMLAMGGRIHAESPGAGHGATMHLIIPASIKPAREAA
ncbi:MAG: CHASE4 domain-containing protein [Rhodospirillales bacterium]